MKDVLIYPIGETRAVEYASGFLTQAGLRLTDHPSQEITHLLLDVPSFRTGSKWERASDLKEFLRMVPQDVTLIGGNLQGISGYKTMDLLTDPDYLAENGYITAECALQVASSYMEGLYRGAKILILGWGRIGKCLARILQALGADVTVAARRDADRALARALGYGAVDFSGDLSGFSLIFNTVPGLTWPCKEKHCLKIDLASAPGWLEEDAVIARGLPGKYAPEASGRLMARRILELIKEDGS